MSRRSLHSRRGRVQAAAAIAVAGLFVAGLSTSTAQANLPSSNQPSDRGPAATTAAAVSSSTDENGPEPFTQEANGLSDLDKRGSVNPSLAQRQAVPAGATVRWNRYGTPASLSKVSGYLSGPSTAPAAAAARSYLRSNAALFGLSRAQIDDLDLVNDSQLTQSKAHAVLFRQRYGGQIAAVDGMATVGVAPDGRVAYVSSSLARVDSGVTLAPATLGAVAAWKAAVTELRAKNAPAIPPADVSGVTTEQAGDFTTFGVPGFAQQQQVRQRALAMPDGTVHRVFEVNVVNSPGGEAAAYTSFVDAANGDVLVRQNQVDNFAAGKPMQAPLRPAMSEFTMAFQGAYTAADPCGPQHEFTVDAQTQTIIYSASTVNPANDITIKLIDPDGKTVSSQDTLFSPEAQTYSGPIEAGVYKVEVCAFEGADPIVTGEYAGSFTASNQEADANFNYPPKWKYFLANPVLNFSSTHTADNRNIGCWETNVGGVQDPMCDNPPSDLNNLAARMPWDVDPRTDIPTFTTQGNAAITAEAWANPNTIEFGNLTPGAFGQRPFDVDREYLHSFNDVWNNERCNPAVLTPGDSTGATPVEPGNDILASVTSLFSNHNRMHDFSYFLGFTEKNFNLQDSNFGNGGRPGDPEVGNVQSGALTGGPPTFGGRDNANQITLQDGVPGITNQYLFQPIAAGFYAPCVDGDYDFGVVGHEYTHAISNRMVGGPDSGLNGFQGGSMGESWSDQVAAEYLLAHNYDSGVSPFVEGAYVTGNKQTGIRNYRLDDNPLQYGDLGYDFTGPEVHADGEPWSAVQIDIRQAMIAKYNASFPASNAALQRRCAQGNTFAEPPQPPPPAQQCPGNRRWVQLLFDSFLLQSPSTSMLDARDAMLAADKMRFNGANQQLMWREYANNGFGSNASTTDTDDVQPTPGYVSPLSGEGTLKLSAVGLGGNREVPVEGDLFVGQYEARVTPIADTKPSADLPNTVRMVPGTYEFVFQADGYGLQRATATITAGSTTAREIHLSRNVASKFSGASIDGASPNSVNTDNLIDDTEETNFANKGQPGVSVDTTHPFVNVNLSGEDTRPQAIRSVKVSAMLVPADNGAEEGEPQPEDPQSGNRFTALRKFAIEVCTDSTTNDCSSLLPAATAASPYKRIYTSPADAFNGVRPRPLVPALIFKRFDIPDTTATHVRLVALENQCTGQAGFAGDQDNDPLNMTDCKTASTRDESVRAAELEVFGYDTETRPPGDPVVLMTATGKALASAGERVTYTFTYTNLGPKPSSNADIRIVELPAGLNFVDASGTGDYAPKARAVRWTLGTVGVDKTGSVTLTTRVATTAAPGTTLLTTAQFAGTMTFSPPAAAVTLVAP
ncbi:MAG: M36 family metallopeptidase [Propionibacteriales bacterium]|jgi:uncharacterized repeat protein (TIGR01451 family)|nr:M36 family metallopeptidase [Propionibacteriales bacterium]